MANDELTVSTQDEATLIKNLEVAKANNKGINEALFSLLDFYSKEGSYSIVLSLLDDNPIDNLTEEEKRKLLAIKITALLRIEDYNSLLDTLEEKEKLDGDSEIERANTLFYAAIAYEALDEIDKAIESLNKIVDNIPRYSLINKYLKLALLYGKKNDYEKAKASYDYASMIDFNHRNEMFSLVESDLFFLSGKYLDAMNSFESFFLKSPNKYKYLDRYILISIKLNRLDDAYKFYLNYRDKPGIRLSSQNQYRFLNASYILLTKLGKTAEASELLAENEKIKPNYFKKAELEKEALIISIVNAASAPISKNDLNKNIVFHALKLLSSLKYNSISFIEKTPDGFNYNLYLKDRVKTKKFLLSDLNEKNLLPFFQVKEDEFIQSFVDLNLETTKGNFILLPLVNSEMNFGFLLIDGLREDIFIYQVFQKTLVALFTRLFSIVNLSKELKTFLNALPCIQKGLIELSGERVRFFDSYSKDLFEAKGDLMPFVDFNNLSVDKNIFVNNFKNQVSTTILFMINGQEKIIEFLPIIDNGFVYAFVFDVTKTKDITIKTQNFLVHSGLYFYNTEYFMQRISQINVPYAIMGLTISLIDPSDSFTERDNKLSGCFRYLSQTLPSAELYYFGENHFGLIILTQDRRVLEGAYSKINSGIRDLYKYSSSLRENKIVGFASKALKNKDEKEIISIMEYGFEYSNKKHDFIILDNDEKKDYALFKTYESEIVRRLKEAILQPEYLPILDNDNRIHYFFSKFNLPFSIPYATFEGIISKNDLESKTDQVLIEKVFNEMMQYNSSLRLIIPLHPESIFNENFIKKSCLLFKKCHLENRVILSVKNIENENYEKALSSLRNAGIKLATTFTNLSEIKDTEKYNLIFIDFEGSSAFIEKISQDFKSLMNLEVVSLNSIKIKDTLSMSSKSRIYSREDLLKF